ncbi:MAG TPA: hypothetical protein PKN33_11490 [Phycisphaerae bacterium]|nr:hypothetical protein [Phycisphaerae bacterium]
MNPIPKSIKRRLRDRPKLRSFVFWGGSTIAVLIFIVMVLSAYHHGYVSYRGHRISIGHGAVTVSGVISVKSLRIRRYPISDEERFASLKWAPVLRFGQIYRVVLPLWIPFLLCLVATIAAWRSKPEHLNNCKNCGYDLTANESGVCPECGTNVNP